MDRDDRIDAYIADRSAEFARPILTAIREAIHAADGAITEDIKWSAPAFLYKGKTLAVMAAFQRHAALNFMRGRELDFAAAGLAREDADGMGQLGKLVSVDDLPPAAKITALARQAMALEAGAPARERKKPVKVPPIPQGFAQALDANPQARTTFDGFPPGARRDYVEWIAEAKREATRERRIAQAIEWLAEGKKHNWKYEKC